MGTGSWVAKALTEGKQTWDKLTKGKQTWERFGKSTTCHYGIVWPQMYSDMAVIDRNLVLLISSLERITPVLGAGDFFFLLIGVVALGVDDLTTCNESTWKTKNKGQFQG